MSEERGYTVVTVPFAVAKRSKRLFFLTVFELRGTDVLGRKRKHRVHTVTMLDVKKLKADFEGINDRMIQLLLSGESVDALSDRLLINLKRISQRRDGAASAKVISGAELNAVLGIMTDISVTGGIAALTEDDADKLADAARDATTGAGTIVALGAFTTTLEAAAGAELTYTTLAAALTAPGWIVVGAAVIAAGGAGYLIGTAAYEGGGVLIDWIAGDDNAEDPAAAATNPNVEAPDGGTPDAGSGDGDGGTADDDDGDGGDDDDDAGTDDDGDDSDAGTADAGTTDDDDGGTNDTDAGDDSTPTPEGPSNPLGALILFFATGLGAQQFEQQRRAIEIFSGGGIGAPDKDGVNIFDLDHHIAAGYLKLIAQQLETKQNQYGTLIQSFSAGPINYGALTNFGLTNPTPIDLAFFGQTAKTLRAGRLLK